MSLSKESLTLGFVHWFCGESPWLSEERRIFRRTLNTLEKILSSRTATFLFYVLTAIFTVATAAMVCIALDQNVAGWFSYHVFSQDWYQSLQNWWQK